MADPGGVRTTGARALHAPDPSACDLEPIHIPGFIQPQGVLLVVRSDGLVVTQASANLATILGVSAEASLGRRLDEVVGAAACLALGGAVGTGGAPGFIVVEGPGGTALSLRAHRSGALICMEIEPAPPRRGLGSPLAMAQAVIEALGRATGQAVLCDAAVRELKALLGFDRVMVYRFGDDGHGEVVAEACAPGLPPYLGLRYPASDIPQQARRLYLRQTIRAVGDVDYQPVPILSHPVLHDGTPLDMTHCALRSVSPLHLEYLRNMNVTASLSVSLIGPQQDLWGMVVCHHATPRWIGAELDVAARMIGQVMSLLLHALEEAEVGAARLARTRTLQSLVGGMAAPVPLIDALCKSGTDLLDLVDATGAVIRLAGEDVRCIGRTPPPPDALQALSVLGAAASGSPAALDDLGWRHPELSPCTRDGSGALLLPLSRTTDDAILWFRPELSQTVTWAGDPGEHAGPDHDGGLPAPRRSFEAWKEIVRGRSARWREADLALADEFRHAFEREAADRANACLRESEARLGFVLTAEQLGSWEFDPVIGGLRCSDILKGHFGRPADQPFTYAQMLAAMHPDDRQNYQAEVAHAVEDGREFKAECRAIWPDGSVHWIELRGQGLHRSGERSRRIGVSLDITARKLNEAELRSLTVGLEARVQQEVAAREAAQARAAHAERLQALGQLAGGIAHDFNNVLQAVAGAAALIERQAADGQALPASRGCGRSGRSRRVHHPPPARVQPPRRPARRTARRGGAAAAACAKSWPTRSAPRSTCRSRRRPTSPPLACRQGPTRDGPGQPRHQRPRRDAGGRPTDPVRRTARPCRGEDRRTRPGLLPAATSGSPSPTPAWAWTQATLHAGGRTVLHHQGSRCRNRPWPAHGQGFAEQSGGALSIESSPGEGTTVTPLAAGTRRRGRSLRATQRRAGRGRAPERPTRAAACCWSMTRTWSGRSSRSDLEDAGYEGGLGRERRRSARPARRRRDGGVIVTDLSMPGMDGVAVIRAVRERLPGLPAVLLTGYGGDGAALAVGGGCRRLRTAAQADPRRGSWQPDRGYAGGAGEGRGLAARCGRGGRDDARPTGWPPERLRAGAGHGGLCGIMEAGPNEVAERP